MLRGVHNKVTEHKALQQGMQRAPCEPSHRFSCISHIGVKSSFLHGVGQNVSVMHRNACSKVAGDNGWL